MAKENFFKASDNTNESIKNSKVLIRAESELEKKKQELIRAKKKHKKLAGEFIDLWVKVRRLKKNTDSTLA